MPITLIVEDGTGLLNSNTYITSDDAIQWAGDFGVTLADGVLLKSQILLAAIYLETFSDRWAGQQLNFPLILTGGQTTPRQAMAWPRQDYYQSLIQEYVPGATNVFRTLNPVLIPLGVPQQIKDAQCQLVYEQAVNSIKLFPSSQGSNGAVILERFDVFETRYEPHGSTGTPIMPLFDKIIEPLVVPGAGAPRTVRL